MPKKALPAAPSSASRAHPKSTKASSPQIETIEERITRSERRARLTAAKQPITVTVDRLATAYLVKYAKLLHCEPEDLASALMFDSLPAYLEEWFHDIAKDHEFYPETRAAIRERLLETIARKRKDSSSSST